MADGRTPAWMADGRMAGKSKLRPFVQEKMNNALG